ncbi:hypothetical protein J8I26_04260 [Herbaspirillum sp. LeCh32-8]|uniref:hypothetical protein n=1 Tax=Herbaspirillum sp. LeCh32-8 TaxID=2821356 RepID=UPI001AE5B05F|nr:hypothetical protein [Herbaspirillum sp. LeCh32-8]MBP0597304.1 hypothetical protein [Herbaspirillum sp. LeCh32-8]
MTPVAPGESFLDWWFAPWSYARGSVLPSNRSALGRRDAYRDWCRLAGVTPDLPARGDLRWQIEIRDGDQFRHAATLYGGLFAARRRDEADLACLAPAQRRWCLGVALAQPLQAWATPLAGDPCGSGLVELALRMERAFPGLWSRLRLLLPDREIERVEHALLAAPSSLPSQPRERERNCWQLCLAQARAGSRSSWAPLAT